jgi:hypothetical protein
LIFYDGTYRLQHSNDSETTPIRKWAYAWRVRIINLSISEPQVAYLKPYIVFVTPSGEGIFKTNCAESLGKTICRDFDLNLRETLWVEKFQENHGSIYVAMFTPKDHHATEIFYSISWRSIRPNEIEALKAFLPDSEC